MLPAERRRRIWQRLQTQRSVRTRDLAREFGVSNLTIHRDLQRLAEKLPLELVRGGAVCTRQPARETDGAACAVCGKTVPRHQPVTVVLRDGARHSFCCPHCGLLQWPRLRDDAQAMMATCILHGSTLNGLSAWYVVDADISGCCTPSVFAFARRELAERFARGFGGNVLPLEQAVRAVRSCMTP